MEPSALELYLDLLKRCLTASLYDESAWFPLRSVPNTMPMKNPPELMLMAKLPYRAEARENGKDWPFFGYSMIGLKRFDNIRFCVEEALRTNIPGDLVETGVWRGGATIWMRAILKAHGIMDRIVWSADSFEGLPPKGPLDLPFTSDADHSKNQFLKVSLEQVEANFRRFGLLDNQSRFIKGWFKDSLPTAPIEKIAVLRLDGDMYESTMDAVTALYDRVSPGGFVIVDDYFSWQGCHKAIDDFRARQRIDAPIQPIDQDAVFWQVPANTSKS